MGPGMSIDLRTYRIETWSAYVVEAREQVCEISAKWVQNESEERSHDVLPYASGSTQRRNFSIETVLLTKARKCTGNLFLGQVFSGCA